MSDKPTDQALFEYYYTYEFNGIQENYRGFWVTIYMTLVNLTQYIGTLNYIIAIIGLIANTLHIVVLCQKIMRKTSINPFLIGIGVCDLLRTTSFVFNVSLDYYTEIQKMLTPASCLSPPTYLELLLGNIFFSISTSSQYLSVWFGVTMAIFRVFVVKYPLKAREKNLSAIGKAIVLVLAPTILPFWYLDYAQTKIRKNFKWVPPKDCDGFPPNYSQIWYSTELTELSGKVGIETTKIMFLVEGIFFKIIPSILLPIATIVLVVELRKLRKSSSRKIDENYKSTQLVSIMTIAFFIATAFHGVLYIGKYIVFMSAGLSFIIEKLSMFFTLLSILNGTSHFLMCYFFSSQYKKATLELFSGRNNAIPAVTRSSRIQTQL